jgi:hypothetical protein
MKAPTRASRAAPYLVFAGMLYYPDAGWDGFVGAYESEEIAVYHAQQKIWRKDPSNRCDWAQVVDLDQKKIIKRYYK